MIANIVDRRTRPYRWRRVDAIVEATAHDNAVADADQADAGSAAVVYDRRAAISVAEAVTWASAQPGAVTLYLDDEGTGG